MQVFYYFDGGHVVMEVYKISLMDAYMIETIRGHEVSDQELLNQIDRKETSAWQELNPNFDFNELVKLADHDRVAFESIINNGYKVKFITLKGLQNLLQLKFNKMNERDYQLVDNGIRDLKIGERQCSELKQMLSNNWVMHVARNEHNSDSLVRIESV